MIGHPTPSETNYRCYLSVLAGFMAPQSSEPTIITLHCQRMAVTEGFEPSTGFPAPAFQAGSLSRSVTSPIDLAINSFSYNPKWTDCATDNTDFTPHFDTLHYFLQSKLKDGMKANFCSRLFKIGQKVLSECNPCIQI